MKKLIFSLLFLSSLSAFGQETWNVCNSTVNVIPQPSYDSTFVLSAPSRAALAKGMANWTPATSSGASYLVYTAHLFQFGTDAPIVTVFKNTLGGTVVWTRAGSGTFKGTLAGAFPNDKTHILISNTIYYNGSFGVYAHSIPDDEESGNFIYVFTYNLSDGTPIDGFASNGIFIEVKVYL